MRRGVVMVKQPGLFLPKFRGDVFARFHAVAAKRRSRTRNSQFDLFGPVLRATTTVALMRHQSGIFWIPPRIVYP
jgi:hypothetical protein